MGKGAVRMRLVEDGPDLLNIVHSINAEQLPSDIALPSQSAEDVGTNPTPLTLKKSFEGPDFRHSTGIVKGRTAGKALKYNPDLRPDTNLKYLAAKSNLDIY